MIVNGNNFAEAYDYLRGAPEIALDTETNGLYEQHRPFALIASNHSRSFYFDNRILPDSAIRKVTTEILNYVPTKIFQNAKFDLKMAGKQWGLTTFGSIEDTEILGRLVRNDHLKYSLADQAKREGLYKSRDEVETFIKKNKIKKEETGYSQVPLGILAPYALNDGSVTLQLKNKLLPQLDPRSFPVWEMEKLLTKVCYKMERVGAMIDRTYTQAAKEYDERLIREAKHQFHLATGTVYDNKKSTLVDIFKKAGEIIPKTEKGNDSFTDDVLESFTSPAAKLVQKIRFYEKRVSTYYDNFLALADENDVIHPDMRQAGTVTGRFAYRDPNLQNLPKDEDSVEQFVVRGCFKPRPGYVLVAMDYKQQEYRLMLAYAKHYRLIEAVMGGADVHQAMADMVGIKRSEAKTLNFAILYGAGVGKIAAMLGISYEAAKALKDKYFARLLEVKLFINHVIRKGESRGYIYNWLGRKLFINHRDFAYKLPNHLIQGGGADICKTAMVGVDDLIQQFDCNMVLQVHDALYFEMKKEDMPVLIPQIKTIMVDSFPSKNGMLMAVDVKWSEKSLAERDMIEWTLE